MKFLVPFISSLFVGIVASQADANCSYAVVDGTIGLGLEVCYTNYNATTDEYLSYYFGCVNDSGVFYNIWDTSGCTGTAIVDNLWVSLDNTGWNSINCGTNSDCLASYTQYENNGSTCDLDTASYEEASVVIDTCITNGSHSTKYSCYHGVPSKRDWYSSDCSGMYDDIGVADGCDCYDNDCEVTVVDMDCDIGEGTVFENCSYAIVDDFLPLVIDRCYNSRDSAGDKWSIYYECLDMWNIKAAVYSGYDCDSTPLLEANQSVFEFGWDYAHCGTNNNDACEDNVIEFRDYSTNDSYCDTVRDEFETLAIYTDFCTNNGTWGVSFGCEGYGGPAQRIWFYDLNCSGDADYISYAETECRCDDYYGGCELTVILDDCPEEDPLPNCSYAVVDTFTGIGLDVCYNQREDGYEYSVMYVCVNEYVVNLMGYNQSDCEGGLFVDYNASVFDIGWDYAHCAQGVPDTSCVGLYTEYSNNNTNMSYCDTTVDDFEQLGVITDLCLGNDSMSVMYGCDGNDNEAQMVWYNSNCSGPAAFKNYPTPGCDCDYYSGVCQLTDLDLCDEDDPLPNCSYAIVDTFSAIGLDVCYNRRDEYGFEFSYIYGCIDSYNVQLTAWSGFDCEDTVWFNESSSIYAFGDWDINHCAEGEPDDSCLGMYTEYENNNTNMSYCDTNTDEFQELSIVVDFCISNSTMSVMYGCDNNDFESQMVWYNGNCSGPADFKNYPTPGCDCDYYDGTCSLTDLDLCDENDPLPNCSYAIVDNWTPLGLDVCYNRRDEYGFEFSYIYGCIDSYNVQLTAWIGLDCEDTVWFNESSSIYAFEDWTIAHCAQGEPDDSCLEFYTEYENNNTNMSYCDTWTDSYTQYGIVTDLCVTNGTSSVMFGCIDGGTQPAQRIWYDSANCSGRPDEIGTPTEPCDCDYYDGTCRLLDLDLCEDTPYENCSYAIIDGLSAIGIDSCYSYYNASDTASSYSFYYGCLDEYHISVSVFDDIDCDGSLMWSVNTSVSAVGWWSANCGSNTDCVATYTNYYNINETGDCDRSIASYDDGSVVFEACFDNGTHSVYYDCGDEDDTPTMNLFDNTNCSGDPLIQNSPSGCECDYGICEITIVDVCTNATTTAEPTPYPTPYPTRSPSPDPTMSPLFDMMNTTSSSMSMSNDSAATSDDDSAQGISVIKSLVVVLCSVIMVLIHK